MRPARQLPNLLRKCRTYIQLYTLRGTAAVVRLWRRWRIIVCETIDPENDACSDAMQMLDLEQRGPTLLVKTV